MTCGDTQIEAINLRAKLDKLLVRDQSRKTGLDLQFVVSVCSIHLLIRSY